MTRWQPRSPSCAIATTRRSVSPSPWRRRSGSSTASAPANASRQPRLPQRQTGPRSSIVTWPISPAVPARAVVEAAVEHEPGADAGGDLDVDDVRAARGPRPTRSRPARRGWRRSRRERRSPSSASMSSSGRAPIQPGRIAESPTSPLSRRSGPGTPMPTPVTRSASTPTSSSSRRTSRPASAMPWSAAWSTSSGSSASARTVWARSAIATRTWEWPKSMPTATPAERLSASAARRAAVALLEPALVAQLARDARHRRRRQAARAGEVGLRHRPAGAQEPEQPLAVRRAQLARGARFGGAHGAT